MAETILVVDDEEAIVEFVEINLRRAGFDVIKAYMETWGCEMVSVEVLQDLRAMEDSQKKRNEQFAYIKP